MNVIDQRLACNLFFFSKLAESDLSALHQFFIFDYQNTKTSVQTSTQDKAKFICASDL